jgi:hypothetical protein
MAILSDSREWCDCCRVQPFTDRAHHRNVHADLIVDVSGLGLNFQLPVLAGNLTSATGSRPIFFLVFLARY